MMHWVTRTIFALGFAACAAAEPWQTGGASDQATSQDAEGGNPYAQLNDHQWKKVVEGWERLDGADRRWFLTEARKRKARIPSRGVGERQFSIVHRERERFGNIAPPRKAERHAELRTAPGSPREPSPDDPNRYGLGFEQRQRQQPAVAQPDIDTVAEQPESSQPATEAPTEPASAASLPKAPRATP